MRYQREGEPTCGPAALGNALRALGAPCPAERVLAALAGTDSDGTDSIGLMAAARELGFAASDWCEPTAKAAWARLSSSLSAGRPTIIHWPKPMDHWVLALGLLGNRVVVVDSSNTVYNMRENGVRTWSRRTLLRQMDRGKKEYYGIVLARR